MRTIELTSQRELEAWLKKQGEKIRVASVATAAKQWSPVPGVSTSTRTFTVFYEEIVKPSA